MSVILPILEKSYRTAGKQLRQLLISSSLPVEAFVHKPEKRSRPAACVCAEREDWISATFLGIYGDKQGVLMVQRLREGRKVQRSLQAKNKKKNPSD